ncbi:type II toxin-antitoxin system prevent-host-death family antitoxin [Pseudonocardia sp. KRD-184]|uniref:Antitoxin n=1 Tax=Pseudonocardia oceani TaxID=2792013 RepID=A0ABS6UB13_9PSEU|nr:type II toxin-antitoxin system prevent-host-death family antitoxin [Pseudonocardia oceani]MBW0089757.1 type II toxin-antitoxin system prevent-host-death family antitoxin [Pseudonocardia oceani]MBW0094645.1 type II toxin-antitoxin system prevent-host-death family antitoxin [Pseudonocardia oceani]MBW0109502.1 type II toxin-antitoxin system prevent-host-death family antitoxin [Pseudonocardia oceani]MBW0119865.1 type II toxin-antitoxin system prevent-host-death family antitoxin [Pseudonocardia o
MKEAAETIGVRELRQNASRYLAKVKQGQRIAVTDRGELVAYLEPVDEPRTTYQQMVAAGKVRLATGSIHDLLREIGPPPPAEPDESSPFEELMRMRDEERY